MDRLYAPWRMAYVDQPSADDNSASGEGCVFCAKAASTNDTANLVVYRGANVFVLLNLFPYNNGHLMVVPYVHRGSLHDLDDATLLELMQMALRAQDALDLAFHPEGYNLGMNLGRSAGAGIVDHVHLHIVPRWTGDTNYMPVISNVKVLPDALESSYTKIRAAWNEIASAPEWGPRGTAARMRSGSRTPDPSEVLAPAPPEDSYG